MQESASVERGERAPRRTPVSRFQVAEFRRAIEAGDVDRALEFWAEDCVIRAPGTDRVHFQGKPRARAFWTAVLGTCDDFSYIEEMRTDDTIALFLRARFADQSFEAIDFLRIDEQGRCMEMFITFRPYPAVALFSGRVALALARPGDLPRRIVLNLLVWPLELTLRLIEPLRTWLGRETLKRAVARQSG